MGQGGEQKHRTHLKLHDDIIKFFIPSTPNKSANMILPWKETETYRMEHKITTLWSWFLEKVSDQGLVTVSGVRQGVLQNRRILFQLPSRTDQESTDIQQENCLWNSHERKSVSGNLKSSNWHRAQARVWQTAVYTTTMCVQHHHSHHHPWTKSWVAHMTTWFHRFTGSTLKLSSPTLLSKCWLSHAITALAY